MCRAQLVHKSVLELWNCVTNDLWGRWASTVHLLLIGRAQQQPLMIRLHVQYSWSFDYTGICQAVHRCVVNKRKSELWQGGGGAALHFNTQRMSKIPPTNFALEGSSLDTEAERDRTLIVLSQTQAGISAARHAERCVTHLYLEEIYEIKRFVEVTGSRLPQADSMVLFGAFCNFLCTRRKNKNRKRKKNVPKWLEWMYFLLM